MYFLKTNYVFTIFHHYWYRVFIKLFILLFIYFLCLIFIELPMNTIYWAYKNDLFKVYTNGIEAQYFAGYSVACATPIHPLRHLKYL